MEMKLPTISCPTCEGTQTAKMFDDEGGCVFECFECESAWYVTDAELAPIPA